MAVISNRVFIPKSHPFVQNVSLSDLTPRFVENGLTQLEAMSSGVMADTLESPETQSQPEVLWC